MRSSRRNIQQWKELMTRLHTAQSPFQPPHYYESCIVARNLKHERAPAVKLAFAKTYNMQLGGRHVDLSFESEVP